jgi:hypothetical protein
MGKMVATREKGTEGTCLKRNKIVRMIILLNMDLLLSVIMASMEMVDIVAGLPKGGVLVL